VRGVKVDLVEKLRYRLLLASTRCCALRHQRYRTGRPHRYEGGNAFPSERVSNAQQSKRIFASSGREVPRIHFCR